MSVSEPIRALILERASVDDMVAVAGRGEASGPPVTVTELAGFPEMNEAF
jgi:hypothetical protein